MTKSGIYQIRNIVTGKRYVGSASNLSVRLRRHRTDLVNGKHHSRKLQRSWNKHGENLFEISVIEYVDSPRLIEREQYWMDHFDVVRGGYNGQPFAGSRLGTKHSAETRAKMSKKKQNLSAEAKRNMSIGQTGKKYSPEKGAKMSALKKGVRLSDDHRKKLSIAKTGIKFSEEHKRNLKTASLKRYARANAVDVSSRKIV